MISSVNFEIYYKNGKLTKKYFDCIKHEFDKLKTYNVTIFNDHNIINNDRNKKIIDFLNKLKLCKITIFNYTKFGKQINKLNNLKQLELYENCHNIIHIKCSIPNNLPINLHKLVINLPPLYNTYIYNLPNKIQKLNLNFFIKYIPNSVEELTQQNKDSAINKHHKNYKYLITTNKIIRLELFNSIKNNEITLNKLPLKLYYFTIKIEKYFIKRTCFYNISNNFACKKTMLKKYTTSY